jgi:DNA-binding NarL/FixJ family response regulator
VEGAELLAAIRAVHRGQAVIHVPREGASGPAAVEEPERARSEPLSARERQVLGLLAEGHTNREVADRLLLSVKTVETYRARLNEKLGLKTRAEIFRFALRAGLVAAPDPSRPADEPDASQG